MDTLEVWDTLEVRNTLEVGMEHTWSKPCGWRVRASAADCASTLEAVSHSGP